jgi:hypothetical protein
VSILPRGKHRLLLEVIMDREKKKTQVKKTYTKPTVTRVELVAGEAVLALCKFGSLIGPCAPDINCTSKPRS